MSNKHLENMTFDMLSRYLPGNRRHLRRLATVISAELLAGSLTQTHLARQLPNGGQQASRLRWLQRFFDAPMYSQAYTYQPLLAQAFQFYQAPIWHLTLDRTTIRPHELDLLMIGLIYHKRALPLGWRWQPFGMSSAESQMALLRTILPLLPEGQAVIVHGDTEFGSVPMMQMITQEVQADFILSQSPHTYYEDADGQRHYLGDLPLTKRHTTVVENIRWTKEHRFGPLTLFAFYQPHKNGKNNPIVEKRYGVTSLPKGHTLKQLGRQRWGIECLFKDLKSAGFCLHFSKLHPDRLENLLLATSIAYLWAISIGRTLVKQGKRPLVDSKKTTLQLFSHWMGLFGSFSCPWSTHFDPFAFVSITA